MNSRRLAAVATALACALVAPANASGELSLDGVKRTHATVKGLVQTPAFTVVGIPTMTDVDPHPASCTTTSCDFTDLSLTVPNGSSTGRLKVTVTMPRELNASVGLFDARGQRVAKADVVDSLNDCCTPESYVPFWQMSFVVTRLVPGPYQVVVFDRGGLGEFTLDVDFRANPPDRQRGKR